jgi:class 3 adenylate cyclase
MSFQSVDEIEDSLKPGTSPSVRNLYTIWKQRLPVPLQKKSGKGTSPEAISAERQIPWVQNDLAIVTAFTQQALKKEEFLLVCDAYREAIAYWQKQPEINPSDLLKLYSHYATAKTRLGFTRDARQGLEPLADNPKMSRREKARIKLQLGDILREESHHTPALAARKLAAEQARVFYQEALALDSTLLEAHVLNAGMSLILSETGSTQRRAAEDLGREVLALIEQTANDGGENARLAWFKAVAFAVMGRIDETALQCGKLKDFPDITTADLADARYRAQYLAEALDQPRDFFKQAFPPLQLIVFTGHNADLPDRGVRFPKESIPLVREMLAKKLDEMQARVGLVSAAAGADLLFIEAMSQRPGANYHVILPWSEKEYHRTSVEPYDALHAEPFWTPLFHTALENSATLRELGQVFEPGDDVGWEYTQEVTAGLALLTARVSRLDVQPLALWDGLAGRGAGGTSSFVEFWTDYLEQPPIVLDLPPTGSAKKPYRRGVGNRSERDSMHQEVKSMLFADIVGYSKLTEKVIRDFVEIFMQRLSNLIAKSPHAPRNVNTWGDAIYAVFDFAEDAGRFALELTQMIQDGEKEWLQKGLFYEEYDAELGKVVQHPLNIRVGLHTGPVFAHYNPVLRQLGFTGSHVSRAARIEPVAASGEVYASEEFAAMAELGDRIRVSQPRANGSRAKDGDGFVCEYAGSMPLAKNYPGRFRIYRVIPHRVLALEELAMAAHALYCERRLLEQDMPPESPALRPWAELADDYRDANRAQVADLPSKLSQLGYELAPSHGLAPADLQITAQQLEELAVREHLRWMSERQRQGWVYGPVRDNARKHHPSIIPWGDLSEGEKQKDRDTVINLPALIAKAGFRVRKLAR